MRQTDPMAFADSLVVSRVYLDAIAPM